MEKNPPKKCARFDNNNNNNKLRMEAGAGAGGQKKLKGVDEVRHERCSD